MERHFIRYAALGVCALIVAACAQPGNLTGGAKDEQGPRILTSDPLNGEVNFKGSGFTLEFDEFVDISKSSQELVVTPPLSGLPELSMRGKTVKVSWEDTLADLTTYLFNFGEGIVDVNERNPLDSNLFVFSTGPYIDSFQMEGRVVDAYTLAPVEDVLVMLYAEDVDSLPKTSLPRYFGKTNDQGRYRIGYLSPGSYKIFALAAGNSGYLFDMPNEKIAFTRELAVAASPDDTTAVDIPDLRLFEHADTLQFLKAKMQRADLGFKFIFNQRVDSFAFQELNERSVEGWTEQWNKTRDTLTLWLDERDDYDSIDLEIRFDNDMDTLRFLKPSRFAKDETGEANFSLSFEAGKIRHYRPLLLSSRTPLDSIDLSSSLLIVEGDSQSLAPHVELQEFGLKVSASWKPSKTYTFFIPDSSVYDRFGMTNDTLLIRLKTSSKEDFGDLILKPRFPSKAKLLFVEILKLEGKSVRKLTMATTDSVLVSNLPAGKYQIRATFDLNENGRWDPGDYNEGRYPEHVLFFEEDLEIKGNWTEEIEWKVEDQ